MRNRYPGPCKDCGQMVAEGAGYFELQRGRPKRWAVRCIPCTAKGKVAAGNSVDSLSLAQREALQKELNQ